MKQRGDNKIEFKSNTPLVVDLDDAVSTLGALTVPYGTYEKIEFKIRFRSVGNTPALELLGNYQPLNGGGPAVPVILRFHEDFELKFEKKTPTTIDANTDYNALGTLALNLLHTALPQSALAAATQTNGTIVISNNSNSLLYNSLWTLLQSMLKVEIKKR